MVFATRFIDAFDGPVLVIDVSADTLADQDAATRLRKSLSRTLAELPVLLRSKKAGSLSYEGEPHLHRYAVDPVVDAYPVVNLQIPLCEAA